jgi:hypothetical protein
VVHHRVTQFRSCIPCDDVTTSSVTPWLVTSTLRIPTHNDPYPSITGAQRCKGWHYQSPSSSSPSCRSLRIFERKTQRFGNTYEKHYCCPVDERGKCFNHSVLEPSPLGIVHCRISVSWSQIDHDAWRSRYCISLQILQIEKAPLSATRCIVRNRGGWQSREWAPVLITRLTPSNHQDLAPPQRLSVGNHRTPRRPFADCVHPRNHRDNLEAVCGNGRHSIWFRPTPTESQSLVALTIKLYAAE